MQTYKAVTEHRDQKYIDFEPTSDLIVVVSHMGTAKSTHLQKLLEDRSKYGSVVCLGFRKTFVTAFAEKYDLKSYETIPGEIKLQYNPRLII